MNVSTADCINSGSKFVPVVPNPNTPISDPRCILHIPGDWDVSYTYLANQAMDIATANCGVLSTLARGNVHI
jgi:hypothetical protein